jgi:hypothetical protein
MDEEIAFYDALAENESARQVMGEPGLRVIATESVANIKGNVTVDWVHREAARARWEPPGWYYVLRKHGGPLKACTSAPFMIVSWSSASRPRKSLPAASQSTAIRVGKLLVQTYSTRNPSIDISPELFALKHGLHLIWPPPPPGFNASPLRRLSKEKVVEVSWDIMRRGDPGAPKPTWPPQPDPPPVRISPAR